MGKKICKKVARNKASVYAGKVVMNQARKCAKKVARNYEKSMQKVARK